MSLELRSLCVPSLQTASVHFSTAAAQQMASGAGTTVDVPSKARTFWVKKEGDASWAEVTVDSTMSVARMVEEIVRKLGLTDRLSTLTVYVAKDKEGKAVGPPLDSTDSVEEALPQAGKIRIVIKAAGAAAAPGAAATLGQHDNVLRARQDADSPDFATHALQRTRGALLLR